MDFVHKNKEILHGLLSRGHIVMKTKWNQEFVTNSLWMTSSPSEICKAIEEVNNLRNDNKYKESFEKSRCIVEMLEAYPSNKLENKTELLAYVYCCMGETSMEMGHLNDAMEYDEKAKTIAEENDFKEAKSRAHFNLGEVIYKKGEYQRAIDVWTEELPNVSSPVGSSLFNFAISMCYLKLGNYLEALEHGDISLAASDRSGDKEVKLYATVLFAISEAKLELKHANETFYKASSIANPMRDSKTADILRKILTEISTKAFAGFRNKKTDGKSFETKVVDDWFNQLHRGPDNWTEIFRSLEHLQRIIPLRGEAIPDQMLTIFKDILDAKSKGITQNILQMARELLECSESHLDNISQSKNELMALVYSCLGSVYLETGDDVSAMQYHEMSWKIATDNHLLDAQLRALINQARVHTKKQDYLQAIHLLLQKQHTTKLFESTSLNLEIGRCFFDLGYHMEALDYGRRSMISDNKADDLKTTLHSFLLVAHAEVKLQLNLSAEQTLAEAVTIIQALNDKRVQLIAKIIQGEVSCLPGEDEYARPLIDSLQRLYRLPDCWEPKRYDHMCMRRKSIPGEILETLQHIQDAHFTMSYAVILQKSGDIVQALEHHPQNEPLAYQEILAEVYYYMGCAYLGLAHMERFQKALKLPKSVPEYRTLCDRLMAHREKEEYKAAITLIEDKLATGIFKSDLELTLLKAWNGRCYLRWSLVIGERASAAAGKVADKESQLYLLVLAALCEVRLSVYPGICPFFQMASMADRMKKARNMAKALDDKMAVHVIQSLLQEVKERYLYDSTLFLGVGQDIARPFPPVDEDAHQTDPDETARKSDATDPVQETGPVEETEPKELDTVPDEETTPKEAISVPDEETTPKEAISVPDEETTPKETISDYPHHDDEEETNPKEFDTDEYHMSARGEPEGDSHPLTF